jgi:hypothetical protein
VYSNDVNIMIQENRGILIERVSVSFCPQKCHMDWPGIKPQPQRIQEPIDRYKRKYCRGKGG